MIALALLGAALAQDAIEPPPVDADLYSLPIDAQRTLWTQDAARAPRGTAWAKAFLHYQNGPLGVRYEDGRRLQVISDALGLGLAGGFSGGPVRLGVQIPAWVGVTSQLDGYGGAGLGNTTVDLKGTLVDPADTGFGFALGASLDLPTATVDLPLGSSGVGWALQAIGDARVGPLLLAANVGTLGVPRVDLPDQQTLDDAFLYRLGMGYAVSDRGGLSLELAGQFAYMVPPSNPTAHPAEVMAGGYGRVTDRLVLRAGVGTGLNEGIGAPTTRVLMVLGWEPALADAAPRERPPTEGPATMVVRITDPHGDPIDDATWGLSGGTAQTGDTATVEPGIYQVVAVAPGYQTRVVDVEVAPGARAETMLTLVPSRVVVTAERIDLAEKIYFDTNEATIRPESFALMDEIARVLHDNPELARVRIEGHTDSRGSAAFNQGLSERRAAAVRRWLVDAGIDPERLTSAGMGESEPIDPADDEQAWSRNRRVEFEILERR